VQIFGLRRKDVWPSSDFGIRKGLTKLMGKKEILPPEKVAGIGKKWKPYRSYAAYYIWKS
jgi:DNA-3-methyladenine glycosylase II